MLDLSRQPVTLCDMKETRRLSVKLDRMGVDAIRAIGDILLAEAYAAKEAGAKSDNLESKAIMAEVHACLVMEYRKLERFLDR